MREAIAKYAYSYIKSSLIPGPSFSRVRRRTRFARGEEKVGPCTLPAHVSKYPGILGHRDTIGTFSDIFVIINGRGMYSE